MAHKDLKEELRSLIAEIAEVDTIPDDTHFKELGIDSMMGVEIVDYLLAGKPETTWALLPGEEARVRIAR